MSIRGVFSDRPLSEEDITRMTKLPEPEPVVTVFHGRSSVTARAWTKEAVEEVALFREMVRNYVNERREKLPEHSGGRAYVDLVCNEIL